MLAARPRIAILMATFDGARFLRAQLDSIRDQSVTDWRLVVSDDGSRDGTRAIVRAFAAENPGHEVTLIDGPRQGATRNFLHLLGQLRQGEWLAWCDQDDVWLPDRLARGLAALSGESPGSDAGGLAALSDGPPDPDARGLAARSGGPREPDAGGLAALSHRPPAPGAGGPTALSDKPPAPDPVGPARHAPPFALNPAVADATGGAMPDPAAPAARPALHACRTMLCAGDLTPIRPAPLYTRPASFLNALVQACTPGNTTLVNAAGAALLARAAPAAARAGVVSHDWFTYQLIAGAGGVVLRDPAQTVLYRQHPRNVMGRNDTLRARAARLAMLGAGDYGAWLAANHAALRAVAPMLTDANRAVLDQFGRTLAAPGPAAAARLARLGVYRQTRAGTAALLLAAAAGRLRGR
ncbi:glycosyltransferase [Paracoccus luteus]|uniref:glycosyltransferase n=1 Tax=Paracoccus luteus TaxID=2508543 RepID=UPI001431AA19|nr:glycosyltransferase [Paracoccus luteus]